MVGQSPLIGPGSPKIFQFEWKEDSPFHESRVRFETGHNQRIKRLAININQLFFGL
ncbi:hypothetical protein BVRB_2g029160 [Beta vulgaris subsp. vulgaris]|nr:hypothetical protein BVRB_2g029160 [Beta vulgaris subsp. vulgaris]